MGLLERIVARRDDLLLHRARASGAGEPMFATKALQKLLSALTSRESPALLDLGPAVGSNVSFFGEQLGCKIFVEDIYTELDRHFHKGTMDALPTFLARRFPQRDGSIDGVLCWDIIDYLDSGAAKVLAEQLTRVLRPGGALLGFFGTAQPAGAHYTKYIICDEVNLKYRVYPAARGRQTILLNRDIIRMFPGLRVSESFLLKNNLREMLFRKPAYETS